MKNFVLLFVFWLSAFCATAQQVVKAPDITVTNWIANVPADKSFAGKNIVLEFWGTWSVAYQLAKPKRDLLHDLFAGKDLCFVAMTDELPQSVTHFLQSNPTRAIVVADTNGTTQQAFKVSFFVPVTFLIDKNREIKWMGRYTDLTAETLYQFANNQPIALPKKDAKARQDASPDIFATTNVKDENAGKASKKSKYYQNLPIVTFVFGEKIRTSDDTDPDFKFNLNSGGCLFSDSVIDFSGNTFTKIYAQATGINEHLIDMQSARLGGTYYARLLLAQKQSRPIEAIFEEHLLQAAQLNKNIVPRTQTIWVARVVSPQKLKLTDLAEYEHRSSAGMVGDEKKYMSADGVTLAEFAILLNEWLPELIVFEGADPRLRYNFSDDLDVSNQEMLKRSLQKYGIELVQEQRAVEMIVLTDKQ